jgi:hypothetical protein
MAKAKKKDKLSGLSFAQVIKICNGGSGLFRRKGWHEGFYWDCMTGKINMRGAAIFADDVLAKDWEIL